VQDLTLELDRIGLETARQLGSRALTSGLPSATSVAGMQEVIETDVLGAMTVR
jgi:hypothetical protein